MLLNALPASDTNPGLAPIEAYYSLSTYVSDSDHVY